MSVMRDRQNPFTISTTAQALLTLLPGGIWMLALLVAPLGLILVYSFAQRGAYGSIIYAFTLENYLYFMDPLYLKILGRSFKLSIVTTIICLLISYPFALWLVKRCPRSRPIFLLLIVIPFWTNFLIRTYAWIILLRTEGIINNALIKLGLISQPLSLLYNQEAVLLGLVYGFLPFMILPIYASLEKLDWRLIEAAYDLGSKPWQAFVKVILPLTMPGITAGCLLVLVPSLGMFIIPDLMGGAKTALIGNLIQNQFMAARNWQFGSAASIILTVLVFFGLAIYWRVAKWAKQEVL
ncbi:MAG: ABC transporter permease [Bacillota bacterium]